MKRFRHLWPYLDIRYGMHSPKWAIEIPILGLIWIWWGYDAGRMEFRWDWIRVEKPTTCTGIAASWCPIHGSCKCPYDDCYGFTSKNSENCPLHRTTSTHATNNVIEETT